MDPASQPPPIHVNSTSQAVPSPDAEVTGACPACQRESRGDEASVGQSSKASDRQDQQSKDTMSSL